MKDGLGPRVPTPNIEGEVRREGSPAAQLSVSVRNPTDSRSVASGRTGKDGTYAISTPEGSWEIRVSGDRTGDFDSVTREFTLTSPDELMTLPAIDVSAMGAAPSAPPDSAEIPVGVPGDSVRFTWIPPSTAVRSARVQVFDIAGAPVWYGEKTTAASQAWGGLGNQGTYSGLLTPAGIYRWRVKFTLSDDSEGRLGYRSLILP